jgi:hypothetical protein
MDLHQAKQIVKWIKAIKRKKSLTEDEEAKLRMAEMVIKGARRGKKVSFGK